MGWNTTNTWNKPTQIKHKIFKIYWINNKYSNLTSKTSKNKSNNFKFIICKNHGLMETFALDGIKTLLATRSLITRFISILNKKYSLSAVLHPMFNFRLKMLPIRIYHHGENISFSQCKWISLIFKEKKTQNKQGGPVATS